MFTKQVDQQWGLHEHRGSSAQRGGNCLAFVIDPRFVAPWPEYGLRLAVSFGHNPFTPDMAVGFVPPPIRAGEFVFGIHVVGTRGSRIAVFDQWYDAREAPPGITAANAKEYALTILSSISDDKYVDLVSEDPTDDAELFREEVDDLDKFELIVDESTL